MIKYILVLSLFFVSISSNSQILISLLLGDKLNSDGLEFGLEGGVNWASVSGFETKDYARKWNMGFYFDIRIKNQWSIYTGTLVKSELGVANLTDKDLQTLNVDFVKFQDGSRIEGSYHHKMDYFLVPILLKYKFKNRLYTELGPQLGLMYKSWIEFNSNIDDKDVIVKDYNKEEINTLDAGIMFGFGYKLMEGAGWTIGVKYYYGFVDVYKNISNTKNNSLFVKLNIPIGANPKPKKEDKIK